MKHLLIAFIVFVLFSCKKSSDTVPQIDPYFSLTTGCPRFMASDSLQYLDSNIQFINYTDSGSNISYQWDFGDKNFSTQRNPVHSYSKPGIYKVKLFSLYKNKISDSMVQGLRIIIGQTTFKSSYNNSHPVDLEEAPGGGVIFISYAYTPVTYEMAYSITCADSLLKRRWTKDLGISVRLSSIKKINTSEYILSGNYNAGPTSQFCLSKINTNGDLVWQKYSGAIAGTNNYTIVTGDGSLVTIGTTPPGINQYAIIIKYDANGNEIWRKNFDGASTSVALRDPDNIIETVDGYVFASLNSSRQIVLTKLDFNGNIVKQSVTASGTNSTIFETGVVTSGNNFMIYATNTTSIYMFNSSFSFIDSRVVAQSGINHGLAVDNHFYIAEGSHQYAYVRQLSAEGAPQWSSIIDNVMPITCAMQEFGVTRYCNKIMFNTRGELVAAIEGEAAGGGGASFIAKYGTDGKLK